MFRTVRGSVSGTLRQPVCLHPARGKSEKSATEVAHVLQPALPRLRLDRNARGIAVPLERDYFLVITSDPDLHGRQTERRAGEGDCQT